MLAHRGRRELVVAPGPVAYALMALTLA
jgi:hypothetical protein